ncbi:MAG: ABC transporter permease [Bacteroidota bacterium]
MKHLLTLEWMKVRRYRTFWVLFTLFMISMFGISFMWWYFNHQLSQGDMGAKMVSSMIFGSFNFPGVFNTITQISSWLLYFPGFVIIFHTTNEFTFKTHRQNIIDGLERADFIKAKLGFAFILAILCTLIVFLSSLFFGIISGGGSITLEGLSYIGYFFVQSCIYILFALLLALLLRRAALAVGIYFIYGILFDFLLALWISKGTDSTLGFYLMPLQVSDQLIPNVITEKTVSLMGSYKTNIALIISVAWIAFYCWFPVRKFSNEDL